MKTLYIVRHAKSSWDQPYLSDFDRPLNERGKWNVPDMGKRLNIKNINPELIISSPANRALTTAKGIAEQIGYPTSDIVEDDTLYHASSRSIIQLIANTDNKNESLMIFGHNPGFTYLINDLSDFYLDNLPTCAVCGIRFEIETWKEVHNQKGSKVFYDYPKSISN